MRSIRLLTISITLLFAAAAALAQSQNLRINPVREDQYATRRMEVVKKSGGKMSSAVRIQSFDPESNSFVMEGVAGETIKVSVSDIQKIEFEQALQQERPMAQEAPFVVTAKPGSARRYKVSQAALRIESGDLILPASSPATSMAAATITKSAETSTRKGSIVATDMIIEAKSLTYDPSSKSFFVEIQDVTYSKEVFGTSGPSGTRK